MPGVDAGPVLPPAIDAGAPVVPPMISTDGGEIPRVTADAGPMGFQPPPTMMPGAVVDAGGEAPPMDPVSGGCSTGLGSQVVLVLVALVRRRQLRRSA